MTKSQLVERVAARAQKSLEDSQKAVDAVFFVLEKPLEKDEILQLLGFGSFRVAWRKRWEGRNPKTNRPFYVWAKVVTVFNPVRS